MSVYILEEEDIIRRIPTQDDSHCDIFQVTGDCGAGKTSILLLILDYCKKRELDVLYYHLEKSNFLPDFSYFSPSIIILDEIQEIDRSLFLEKVDSWMRAGIKLILGSHIDHSGWFPANYRINKMTLGDIQKDKLQKILHRRLEYSSVKSPGHRFSYRAISELIFASGKSIERIRAICYDIFLREDLPPVINGNIVREVIRNLDG
ncbi:MAG: hypothetical protein K8T10_00820 [Candidatus Eremiobacteraeota bacterium]|nr:hypothetical protein [Candidatus Eremiobacteraeota bacterium]